MVMADEKHRSTSEEIQYSYQWLFTTSDKSQKFICSNGSEAAYHSCGSNARSSGDSELRIINSAIYVEPLKSEQKLKNDNSLESVKMDFDGTNEHEETSHIHGSQSLTSSATSSFISIPRAAQSMTKLERRCRIDGGSEENDDIYEFDDRRRRVISSSNTPSVSSFSDHQSSSLIGLPKKIAHEEWMKNKKLEAARRKKEAEEMEAIKREKEERAAREKEERELQKQKNLTLWSERKKQEEEKRRKMDEKRLALVEQLKKLKEEALICKETSLREWVSKKNEAEKVQKEQLKKKIDQMEAYKKKRIEESTKAFEKWREISKNKSKPATQGLLPHQRAIPAYVNPKPWIVEN